MASPTSFLTAYQEKPKNLKPVRTADPAKSLISDRERQVLHLIAYEYSSKEIATKLFVSRETINSHRKNIMMKLGVKNTAGMVRVAFETGLMAANKYGLTQVQ